MLKSIVDQLGNVKAEVIVVDDGSNNTCQNIVNQYKSSIEINYCFKKNTGPGDSRNYGMNRARGNYFILLDSDCLLPEDYLLRVNKELEEHYADAFGGPDLAHNSFTMKQKAISYAMTSFWTTGGLRNSENVGEKFQLRSFNMGMSRQVFESTGGFSKQRIGEDIELNFRIWKSEFSTRFIPEAFVYHKRRTSWRQFFAQTNNFGAARPILNRMYPKTGKLTYWFPSLFLLGGIVALLLLFFDFPYLMILYLIYLLFLTIDSARVNKNILTGLLSSWAAVVQFSGYGSGFLRSLYRLSIQRKSYQEAFPGMFS